MPSRRLTAFILVPGAVALLTAGAQIGFTLPGTEVPQTAQTFALLLIAALLGPRRGGAAVAAYLVLGAAGLPVFADGASGFAVLTGPSGGFLLGFLPAALLAGWAARHATVRFAGWPRRLTVLLAAFLSAHAVVLLCGWSRLALTLGGSEAFAAGVAPFVGGALAKSAAAALLVVGSDRSKQRAPETDRVASGIDRNG